MRTNVGRYDVPLKYESQMYYKYNFALTQSHTIINKLLFLSLYYVFILIDIKTCADAPYYIQVLTDDKVCDGNVDCVDGEDEQDCGKIFTSFIKSTDKASHKGEKYQKWLIPSNSLLKAANLNWKEEKIHSARFHATSTLVEEQKKYLMECIWYPIFLFCFVTITHTSE